MLRRTLHSRRPVHAASTGQRERGALCHLSELHINFFNFINNTLPYGRGSVLRHETPN